MYYYATAVPAACLKQSQRQCPLTLLSSILPQSCTADQCKVLILKFTGTPNMLYTLVSFRAATKPFSCKITHNIKLHGTHTKYIKHTTLRGAMVFSTKQNAACTTTLIYLLQETRD